jgi:flagellar protein FlaI
MRSDAVTHPMSQFDIERILDDVKRSARGTYETLVGSTLSVENYTPSIHGSLISSPGISDHDEIERYWVDMPFAFVSISYDSENNEHRYHVVEPDLDEWEVTLFENLVGDLRDTLIHRRHVGERSTEQVVKSELASLIEEYGVVIDMNTFYRFLYYLDRRFRGYGKLDPIMHDPHVEDISCDGYDTPVFVLMSV